MRATSRALGLGLTALLCFAATSASAMTIERRSADVLFVDSDNGNPLFPLTDAYAAYLVTNDDGVDYGDVFVTVDGFAGPMIGLSSHENGVVHLGPLASGDAKTVFVYLHSNGTTTGEDHVVTVFDGPPAVASVLGAQSFTLSSEETIKANANKVNVVSYFPDAPVVGAVFDLVVDGDTGTLGDVPGLGRIFMATAAAHPDFPVHAFRLIGSRITFTGGNNDVIDDTLVYFPASPANTHYVATYTFRIVDVRSDLTPVSPVAYIASGTQVKHTATDGSTYQALTPVPPSTNTLMLTRTPVVAALPSEGGTVTHTVTITNMSPDQVVSFDAVRDLFEADLVSYVPGSATLDGQPLPDPYGSVEGLLWSQLIPVPAGGTVVITYDLAYPAGNRAYHHDATAQVGVNGVLVDTTLDTTDVSPAHAIVVVGTPPNEAPVGNLATIWVLTGTPSVTFDVAGAYTDLDGDAVDPTSLAVTNQPTGATGNALADGTLTVTPADAGVATSYETTFEICDDRLLNPACATGTATVWYNDPPTVVGQTVTLNAGVVTSIPVTSIRDASSQGDVAPGWTAGASVSDAADGTFGATTTTDLGGTCAIVAGAVVYTPPAGVTSGVDSCFVQLCELMPAGACGVGELVFEIVPPFTPTPDAASTPKDTPLVTSVDTLLTNDGGADPGTFSLPTGTSTQGGTVTVDEGGVVTYTPPTDFVGVDSFQYFVCNAANAADCQTVTVTVSVGENHAPLGTDLEIWVVTGTPSVIFDAAGRFSDPDGDPLTSLAVATPATGAALALFGNGDGELTPVDPQVPGAYTVVLEACDDSPLGSLCGQATVTVHYNDPPTVPDQSLEVPEGLSGAIPIADLLAAADQGVVETGMDASSVEVGASDGGPFGDSTSSQLGGTCEVVDGEVLYTAPAGVQLGTDACWVRVCENLPTATGANAQGRACGIAKISVTILDIPACDDGLKNGNETDVDCGGDTCEPCQVDEGCLVPSDCVTALCGQDGLCDPLPTC
ncbi:MAG: hypothetical protein EP329_24445, partial [Deltaproteobacteria bacterium]